VSFWLDQLGADSALWEPGDAPDPLSDLWADVELALQTMGTSDVVKDPQASLANAWREIPGALHSLSKFERVGIWSFGF
jgi:hypothetical protein